MHDPGQQNARVGPKLIQSALQPFRSISNIIIDQQLAGGCLVEVWRWPMQPAQPLIVCLEAGYNRLMDASRPPECSIALRRMTEVDLTEVLRVECEAYAVPWTEGILRDCLRAGYCCLVADRAGQLIGHAVMSVAAGECHILNLCVAPIHQGRGLGRRMLRRVLALARQREADTAFLEVRASNKGAIRLYQAEGFDEIGLRKGYYPSADPNACPSRDNREDAVLMARAL